MENGNNPMSAFGQGDESCGNLIAQTSEFLKIQAKLKENLTPLGLEAHPFHIEWYNELVGPHFTLEFPPNTVSFVILSGPDSFEKTVIPYLKDNQSKDPNFSSPDPLDSAMKQVFVNLTQELKEMGCEVEAYQDFDMFPSRKPKVLVQTAAHVAGAVEYFHRDRVAEKKPDWLKNSKLFGVAIHPEFGGWFAIRGVLIIKNLVLDAENVLEKPQHPLVDADEGKIAYLLEEFGLNWKNHAWRDAVPRTSTKKYSQLFIDYLSTEPEKRWDFMKSQL